MTGPTSSSHRRHSSSPVHWSSRACRRPDCPSFADPPPRSRRLSQEGKDFIVFLRRGQEQEIKWAGNPHSKPNSLEPRKSFKTFTEKVVGRSRAWTTEELETSGTLLLVYSKFIAVSSSSAVSLSR